MSDAPRTAAEVYTFRKAIWGNGYRLLAVHTGQKNPWGNGWRVSALQAPPLWAERFPEEEALSTGILTGEVVAADVDILIQAITDRVVIDIEHTAGTTPLVRIGQAPKTLMAFRCDTPFTKQSTGAYVMQDGSEAKVEILAEGQQFVADGIHPDTGQPYLWVNASPDIVPLSDLPTLSLEQAQGIIERAKALIVANGGRPKEKPKQEKPARQPRPRAMPEARVDARVTAGDSFFERVNAEALRNLDAWVTKLFPKAVYQAATKAWRVASRDRGRPDLEEDISFHPDGIADFGEECGLTAIDAVIAWGGEPDVVEAARWLCEQMGIAPASLGWQDAKPRQNGPAAPPEERWPEDRSSPFDGDPAGPEPPPLVAMTRSPPRPGSGATQPPCSRASGYSAPPSCAASPPSSAARAASEKPHAPSPRASPC
jgi:hypothetical protein